MDEPRTEPLVFRPMRAHLSAGGSRPEAPALLAVPAVPAVPTTPGVRGFAAARAVCTVLAVAGLIAFAPALAADAPASCGTIKSVEVRGNVKMSADAVRFDLAIKPGARWDDQAIRREYTRLWNRGYFADLRFARRCEPDGAVLIVEMKERPTILSITYEKSKVVTQQQIEDHFKERDFTLTVGSPLDRKKLWRAEQLIKEVLGQKGYMDAEVTSIVKETSASTRAVTFRVRSGGKTKIRTLDFVGNQEFRDRTLDKQLKLIAPWRWYWPWSGKALYHPLKYQQDITNVIQFYKDRGFLDADIKPAVVDVRAVNTRNADEKAAKEAQRAARKEERRRAKEARKAARKGRPAPDAGDVAPPEPEVRTRKWVYITVPVDEGPIYQLGEVKFEGNTVFKNDELRPWIPLRTGAVLSDAALEAGISYIRNLYGTRGYVYAAVTRRIERREAGEAAAEQATGAGTNAPDADVKEDKANGKDGKDGKARERKTGGATASDRPVADVVVQIDEDQAYTVRRIEFQGNTDTQDEVLRREMNVHEGELLNKVSLDRSVQKLQQLGFWVPGEEPALEPVPGRTEVDVRVQGEEQSRNEIQVGGGYSELDGGFFMGSYATQNFLGRGERLAVDLAIGGRSSRASLSFTEPWFLGKPYIFGFQIFRRRYDFGTGRDVTGASDRLTQASTGGALTLGRRIGDFTQFQVGYQYESVEADTYDVSSAFARTTTQIATITPVLSFKRVNNYLRPTRGLDVSLAPQLAGRFLGGDANYVKPRFSGTVYFPFPFQQRLFVAAHLEGAYILPFGKLDRRTGNIDGIPRFERFFLGGDTYGPRVFESRTITPVELRYVTDVNGNPSVDALGNPILSAVSIGGNKMVLGQFELGLPVGKTATFAAFLDAGGVYAGGQRIDTADLRVSAGVEFRVFLPVFQAPIRLIYGWPLRERPGDETNRFQFSIGLPF